eukprot:m.225382 g.225382  ORF g.225382 m.225382 type:complete len:172 (+) comp40015_c0_seq2:1292-1807(+)
MLENRRITLVRFSLWTAGERAMARYSHMEASCQKNANAILFLFSMTDRASFEDIPHQIGRVVQQESNVLKIAVATQLRVSSQFPLSTLMSFFSADHMPHSDVTEEEVEDFEKLWSIPVLFIANTEQPRAISGHQDGKASLLEVSDFVNNLTEILLQKERAKRKSHRDSIDT